MTETRSSVQADPVAPPASDAPAPPRRTIGDDPECLSVRLPAAHQRPLTVILTRDDGPDQADADLAAVAAGRATVLKAGVSEMYFQQLRFRAQQEPTLHDQIAVFYCDHDNVLHPVGLRADDESSWPRGFLQDGWKLENEIQKLRREVPHG